MFANEEIGPPPCRRMVVDRLAELDDDVAEISVVIDGRGELGLFPGDPQA
jgi:hypothetical protein